MLINEAGLIRAIKRAYKHGGYTVANHKMQAAIRFASSGEKRKAIITSLYKAEEALAGRTGTVIVG